VEGFVQFHLKLIFNLKIFAVCYSLPPITFTKNENVLMNFYELAA